MNLKAEIESGLDVRQSDNTFLYQVQHQGFGALRKEEPAAPEATPLRTEHFVWPHPMDKNQLAIATVRNELTTEAKDAAEYAALACLTLMRADATMIIWRVAPQWERDRDFYTQTTTWVLYMRGSFVWAKPCAT
jgi:hypothetical protein